MTQSLTNMLTFLPLQRVFCCLTHASSYNVNLITPKIIGHFSTSVSTAIAVLLSSTEASVRSNVEA